MVKIQVNKYMHKLNNNSNGEYKKNMLFSIYPTKIHIKILRMCEHYYLALCKSMCNSNTCFEEHTRKTIFKKSYYRLLQR